MIYGLFSFLIFFGLFCVIIQSNLFLHGYILPVGFDLTIPLTLYVGLSQKPSHGAFLVVWFGFLIDVFSASIMGTYTFLRVFMFLLVQILKRGLFLENKVFFGLLVLGLFFLEAVLISSLFTFTGSDLFFWGGPLVRPLGQGILTLLVWYGIYPSLVRLESFFEKG